MSVKKSLDTKVLKELGNGYTVKMIRKFKEVKMGKITTRQLESSSMGLFKGKKLMQGDFNKVEDVISFYNTKETA